MVSSCNFFPLQSRRFQLDYYTENDFKASVGKYGADKRQCYNTTGDQQMVQDLLNKIPVTNGGTNAGSFMYPEGKLKSSPRWGIVSEELYQAILHFQRVHATDKGLYVDGHVDPHDRTIRALLKYAYPLRNIDTDALARDLNANLKPIDGIQIDTDPHGPRSIHFKVRFDGVISLGDGFVGDGVYLEVWDVENNLLQDFVYVGVGAGLSFSGAGSMVKKLGEKVLKALKYIGSVPTLTVSGPFSDFMTTKKVGVGIFSGPAHWTSLGTGPWSINVLQVYGVGGDLSGVYMKVQTGVTLGASIGSSFGFMVPVNDPQPFTGS
jgi:hypothetical protein